MYTSFEGSALGSLKPGFAVEVKPTKPRQKQASFGVMERRNVFSPWIVEKRNLVASVGQKLT